MTLIIIFYKYYCDIKKFDNLSFKSKYSFMAKFFKYLNTDWLEIYFDEYKELPIVKINKMYPKYDPESLFLKAYMYEPWLKNEESTGKEESVDLSDMSLLKVDEEEVKYYIIYMIRDPKILFPNFDWPKYVDENLKHKIKLIEYWI